jgi:hypothetical protein
MSSYKQRLQYAIDSAFEPTFTNKIENILNSKSNKQQLNINLTDFDVFTLKKIRKGLSPNKLNSPRQASLSQNFFNK